MVATINASVSSSGIVSTADGSGVLKVQSNGVTTNALAWVCFNGSTAAIRSSYNVSSITRSGAGQYTVSYTNALSDANYAISGSCGTPSSINDAFSADYVGTRTTAACYVGTYNFGSFVDATYVSVAVFGN